MKWEEWIGVLAALFIAGLIVMAIVPNQVGSLFSGETGLGQVAQFNLPQPGTVGQINQGPQPQALQVAAQQPAQNRGGIGKPQAVGDALNPVRNDGGAPVQPGLVPFRKAPLIRFDGTIQQISEIQWQDKQIHIWLSQAGNRELHISVAPSWFLAFMGCTLQHDMQVSGRGFKFDRVNKDAVIYAKYLKINGRNCHLRNDEGFALWSNKLR
ncbi:magnetosome protein MamS [Magnetococcus sp. PR-3]|uniref:magnetosome protein MamS n=1 Tax=Magnetococcus sp. PR-3 TaxID=3120355 RepID=UPI002FCE334D